MGFGQGLSGLNAAAQNLDVIGNNIANSGTVGFKSGSATFADVYANSRVGLGVQTASINQRFTTGIVSSTGNQFDMAIDGAKGFFVVQNTNGAQFYTRNGQFFANKENQVVNAQGQQLMGYAPNSTNLIGMTVPVGNIDPMATSNIANQINLDANAAVVPNTTVPGVDGAVQLTQNGMTTPYSYRINADGSYTWLGGSTPPAGSYTTQATTASSTVTATAGTGQLGPISGLPTTGGNIAPVVAADLGTIYLDGQAYYYTVDDPAAATPLYTWVQSDGSAGGAVPADGSYDSGAAGGTPVTITASGSPSESFPDGSGNTAYVAPVTAIAFDPGNPNSFSNALPITVYDSLGNEHRLTQYYTKRPAVGGNSVWDVNYRIDGQLPGAPLDAATQLTFDPAGRLISSPSSYTVSLANPGGAASPAQALNILVNYAGSTQFGGGFTQNFVPDGYASGEYASTSIGANGEVIANYTNGAKQVMGTLALADFNNLQGLQSVGGNAWAETAASGQPILGAPGSNGLATIKGQAVEESNVDMSQELVNMIIAQRTYQANAQTIKTQDQILQTLITMR